MKNVPEHLLYESAFRGNILPLTSSCNVNCIFCSHRQNPPGIQIYKATPRTPEEVRDTLQFISPERKIVIGESVTRIIEGEPFTHPRIREILIMLREYFPETGIQITTNGTLVTSGAARFLAELGGVEIYLSLNSCSPLSRTRLMHDKRAHAAVSSPYFLADAGIPFHGSVVAMPHITGWDDLGETLDYLAQSGARTIRVFYPGFTRFAAKSLMFSSGMREELARYINSVITKIPVPVTIEPPLISDLKARVRGVIAGSPADRAGLLGEDIIISVNGVRCISRVDAFNRLTAGGPGITAEVQRGVQNFDIYLEKESGVSSGVVMDYDIDPETIAAMEYAAARYGKAKLLCSEFGEPIIRMALEKSFQDKKIELIPVKNRYFGGSIMAAGLLTVTDFIRTVADVGIHSTDPGPLLVPAVAFDNRGVDLVGNSYLTIQERTGLKVEIL